MVKLIVKWGKPMISHYSMPFIRFVVAALTLMSFLTIAKRPEFQIELKNHLFFPSEIEIPENTKVKLIIYNRDQTPEEFDSFDLNREKVIFPEKKSVIFIGPLPHGRYEFFGEFNPNSAKGAILVIPQAPPQVNLHDIDNREFNEIASTIALQKNNLTESGVVYVD